MICGFDMIRVCLERDTGTKISKEDDSWRYINGTAFFSFSTLCSPPSHQKSSFAQEILGRVVLFSVLFLLELLIIYFIDVTVLQL